MDQTVQLIAALGPLIGGIGSTIGVIVVAFRKSNRERGQAAENALSTVDETQTEALERILKRLEQIDADDRRVADIQEILRHKRNDDGGGVA